MEFPLNHDLHLHTQLSLCSGDPEQNAEYIVKFAEENGYSQLCMTDHFWDETVPGASGWYQAQNFEHVSKTLPLPHGEKTKVFFGCETEFCGGKKIGISKETCGKFDFVVIPPNHFHMEGFTRDASVNTPEAVAKLFGDRLIELTKLDLPWGKIGIAHLTCDLAFARGDCYEVFRQADRAQLREAFAFFAEKGTGIELNDGCFSREKAFTDDNMDIYFMAKEAGCKFYRASDAHHPAELPLGQGTVRAAKVLGLTEKDLYVIK